MSERLVGKHIEAAREVRVMAALRLDVVELMAKHTAM